MPSRYPADLQAAWDAWIAEAWTDRHGTIHGLDPKGPLTMLEEILLTPAELEAARKYVETIYTVTEAAGKEQAILLDVLAILVTTAKAGNYRQFRVPKHALTAGQRAWIKEALGDLKAAPETDRPLTIGTYRVTDLQEKEPGTVVARLTNHDGRSAKHVWAVTDSALRIGQLFSLVETG